jgi:hypothetical protein
MKAIILIIISLGVTNIFAQQVSVEDTAYVKQKHRFPLWTYYNKNTIVSGLSLGFGQVEARNIVTNGIKISVPGIGAMVFMFPNFIGITSEEDFQRGQEYRTVHKNTRETVNGFYIGGCGDFLENTYVNGIDINLIANYYAQSNGISLTGLANYLGINNGLQIARLLNDCGVSNGVQVACFSHAIYAKGLQIGGCNIAKNGMKGVQIGLYNRCKNCSGIQIGLWNKNDKRSLPLVNWKFK